MLDRAIGIGLPPITGVDDLDRFSRGMSSGRCICCWTTCGLLSLERILGVLDREVLGEEERVRVLWWWLSLTVRRDAGVAGCLMVDLSKLLNVLMVSKKGRGDTRGREERESTRDQRVVSG